MLRYISKEWLTIVTFIKESNDLKVVEISTLFGNFTSHEHELKKLEASEEILKMKEKVNQDKRNISLKALSS